MIARLQVARDESRKATAYLDQPPWLGSLPALRPLDEPPAQERGELPTLREAGSQVLAASRPAMNLGADMASTFIVLTILLGGALAAIPVGRRSPVENLSDEHGDSHRWP